MISFFKLLISLIFCTASYCATRRLLRRDGAYIVTAHRHWQTALATVYLAVAAALFFCRLAVLPLQFALDNSFVFMLLSVAVVDLLTQYIYDLMLLSYSAINLALIWSLHGIKLANFYGGAVGFALYGAVYGLARLFYDREAFGMGDVFLLAACGIVLSVKATVLVALLAFYVALLQLVIYFVVKRILRCDTALAFAPAIGIAATIIYFVQIV